MGCKVGKCKESYVVRGILTALQKKVHESIAKKEILGTFQLVKGAPNIKINNECLHL
jgi:hypothetical protein